MIYCWHVSLTIVRLVNVERWPCSFATDCHAVLLHFFLCVLWSGQNSARCDRHPGLSRLELPVFARLHGPRFARLRPYCGTSRHGRVHLKPYIISSVLTKFPCIFPASNKGYGDCAECNAFAPLRHLEGMMTQLIGRWSNVPDCDMPESRRPNEVRDFCSISGGYCVLEMVPGS